MKIASITDVVTNSSSEVFTLRTTKSPGEVYQWLKDNIPGGQEEKYPFSEPVILKDGCGILRWLKTFGYVYNSGDSDSTLEHKIVRCLNYANRWYDSSGYHFEVKHGGKKVEREWRKFCKEHISELLMGNYTEEEFWDCYEETLSDESPTLFPGTYYYDTKLRSLLIEFISRYESKFPTPGWWKIPKDEDVQYWEGKIGFVTTEENSIRYDDMEKICNKFDGEHWHMG